MDAIAGVSATRVYQLILNGRPQSGATLTYSLWDPTGAVALNAVAVTDVGDGTYTRALDGTDDIPDAGTYRELWLGSYAGQDLRAAGPVLVGSDAGQAVTRRELRWEVARQLRDLWLGTATAVTATTVTVPELSTVQNEWMGHELYVYAGTGVGQTRRVTASGDFTGVLTVPTWTTQPTGASIEAHKKYTVDAYNGALRRAVREARGVYVEMEDRSLLQASDTMEYTIPTGLLWLATVETQDSADSDSWTPLLRDDGDWTASAGLLRLAAGGSTDVRMRLRGYRAPQQLDYDEQYADLDPAYLVDKAASLLTASDIRAAALDRQAAAQQSAYWQLQAAQMLPRTALHNAVWVGG